MPAFYHVLCQDNNELCFKTISKPPIKCPLSYELFWSRSLFTAWKTDCIKRFQGWYLAQGHSSCLCEALHSFLSTVKNIQTNGSQICSHRDFFKPFFFKYILLYCKRQDLTQLHGVYVRINLRVSALLPPPLQHRSDRHMSPHSVLRVLGTAHRALRMLGKHLTS